MYDIIIIGAGPAGLTAAIYASRASKKVLVLEANSYGGQIINALSIENYPGNMHISGFDLASSFYHQAKELGAVILFERVLSIKNGKKIKKVITDKTTYEAKAIIIATGCSSRSLSLSNEKMLIGRGLSYCATCDGAFFREKIVAIVGGGNTAIEDAIYLSDIAKKVYLIHRRDKFKADDKSINLLRTKTNVEFLLNSNVVKLNGNDKLESIDVKNNNKIRNIQVDGLFIAIGKVPETDIFKNIINLDDNGYIIAKENCHTNKLGIFVAGDVRRKNIRQLVTATSDGSIAAIEAINYINSNKMKI